MALLFEHGLTTPIFVGRHAELQALRQFIDQMQSRRGQAVLIAGEAGIGKSRLLAEVQTYAVAQGCLPFRISCFQSDSALPYAPLFAPLQSYLWPAAQSSHSPQFFSLLEELALLLPELAPASSPLSARLYSHHLEPEQKKYRLLMTLNDIFAQLATEQPLVMLVEDVHWSDESTLEFLLHLMRRAATLPIVFLLTYRSDEIGPELRRWLAQLDREHRSHDLHLARFSRPEVDTLLQAILRLERPPHPHLLETLYTLTEGNPFFVEELLKSMILSGRVEVQEGRWESKPIGELEIPRTVQASVQQRSEQLSPDARRVVHLAAVMGRHFDFTALQALTQHSEFELLALMKELIAAQLIIEESEERFVFRHALTRQALYNNLLARERRLYHEAIARTLERIYSPNLERWSADLAYHFYEAAAWEQALFYSMQAGEHARMLYALRPALEHFTRGIEAARQLDRSLPLALLRARGLTYEMLGELRLALADLESVLRQAQLAEDQPAEWQALLDLGLLWTGQSYEQAGHFYQRAFELAQTMGQPAALANSLNCLGNWHLNLGRPPEAHRYHQEALTLFQQLQDHRGIADTLDLLGMASYLGADLVQGTRDYQQAVELFHSQGQQHGLISSLTTLTMRAPTYQTDTMVPAMESLMEAAQDGERALKIAREIGHRSGELYAMIMLGICLGSQGAYQPAFELAQQSLTLAHEIDHRQWITAAHVALGALYTEVLALPQAMQELQQAFEAAKEIQSLHWVQNAVSFLVLAYVRQGEFAQAERVLQAHLDPDAAIRTLGQRLLWRARGELALAQGDGAFALQVVERLFSSAANLAPEHILPRLAKLRGDALFLLGQSEAAEAEFSQAQAVASRQGAKPLLWRIHASLANLYQARERLDEASQHSQATHQLLAELALQVPDSLRTGFSEQALRLLPPAQQSTAQPTGQSASVTSDPDALTGREREVAVLLAQGHSNRQIGEQLVVSERTAETHVRNILAKLNFTSRTQIALWAVETGLVTPQTPNHRDEGL
jgi:DNA-binding CsgD family transcriptional regulator